MKSIALFFAVVVVMNGLASAYPGRWGQALALAKRTGEEVIPYVGPASDEEYRAMERRLAFLPDTSSYYNPYSRSLKRKEPSGSPTNAPRRQFNTQGWKR
ncbi:uncharacterized protein LOC100898410 [Galendromus occidentalis]|uniref:Uncharacterized protein LOC100898410 n=1 Tax=Galendromus occidentalis TaxID=34638 RepID=A0AAJ6VXM7_9ACAR|nr:uncharacterized protein LOC100898410 [Galendromus occidentalis]